MDLRYISCEGVKWIQFTHDRLQWDLVNVGMKFKVV
jgi:hypothetical protein